MTVSSPKLTNRDVDTLSFIKNPQTLNSPTKTLAISALRTSGRDPKEKFTPLIKRVERLDRNFFSSPERSVTELSRAIEMANRLSKTEFGAFLFFQRSLTELRLSYQNSLILLSEKAPEFFQIAPKVSNFIQCSNFLQIPCIEWETTSSKEDLKKIFSDFTNHLKEPFILQNQFESLEDMKITFNHLRKFLIDPIPHEIGRDFCVTRMLWVSFILEKMLGIECLECHLVPSRDYFYFNKHQLDPEASLELEKYLTPLLHKEELDSAFEDKDKYFLHNSLSTEEKVFYWNYHAAVLVMCKIQDKQEPYVFDMITLEPVRFDLWKQIFQGEVVLRSCCKTSNIISSDLKPSLTFDVEAKDTQWKLDTEIQINTLQLLSASYQSALKGKKSETLYLSSPFGF